MSSIKKNFLYNAAYNLLNICLPIITTPYLSRVLGANGVGIYSYSYSMAHFFAIFIMLGLNNYGCREVAKCAEDRGKVSRVFWSIYFLQLSLGIIVNAVYFVYCFGLAENRSAAIILSLYTLSACFDTNWFFWGLERFQFTATRSFVVKIVKTICVFLFVKNSNDAYKYCAIMASGFLINHLILWPSILKRIDFVLPRIKEIMVHLKPNLMLFITVIAVSIFKYMDKVMLGLFSNMTEVGFYESAERIISVPTALITALGTVMLPRMTSMLARNKEGFKSMLHVSVLFSVFLASSMGFGIMGISKEFVPLFYGAGYEICVTLYLILLPSCIFLGFANVIRTQYLLPNHMDKAYIISAILGAGVNLIMNALLIPLFGAIGVAIGTLAAEIVVCVYQSAMVARKISLKPYVYDSLPLVGAGIIMFVSIYCLKLPGEITVLGTLMIKIAIGIMVYFVAMVLWALIFRVNYKKIIKRNVH